MKLKKFKEYTFTENTEAKDMGGWHEVCSYEKTTKPISISGDIHCKDGIRQMVDGSVFWLNYDNIQELREKPKKIELLDERKAYTADDIIDKMWNKINELEVIYVNIYKEDNRIEIACDLEQAKRLESINDMRSRAELLHRFKGMETNYVKYFKYKHFVKDFERGWTAKKTEIGLTIYFGTKRMYQLDEYKSDIEKYYILEILYDSEQEPLKLSNSVLKNFLPPLDLVKIKKSLDDISEKPKLIELLDERKSYTTDDIIDKMWNKINELIVFINYLIERENNEIKKI